MKKLKVDIAKITDWGVGEDVEKLLGPVIRRHLNLLLKELKHDPYVYVEGGHLVLSLGEAACLVIRVPFKQIDALKKQYEADQ